ncbi:hypothetical protein EDD18DRAFT_1353085 [Armillaria luteobubalina]|uniref:Zn(2)-C6 fungal-type domain-containing protein n=1 Tax=Armillaria luteobubalina TaxID=153913 RepID=A0AA39Q6R3_9AGAR|nr:hypothetical protein EDD18DRAFT_1353085 [Armillaria luteobubalina]
MAKPTDPKEVAIVNAQEQYETSSTELNQLISSLPPKDADFSIINMWVIDAQFHWETCSFSWRTAKVSSIEWCRLEYNLLELFAEIPDNLVAYSCAEYNELVKRACQFNMDVIPVPMSQMPSRQLAPKELPSLMVFPPTVLTRTHTATPAIIPPVPQVASVPSPVVVPPLTNITTLPVLPPREPLPVKPHPIYKKKTTAVSDELATAGTVFALDVTSPLHPDLATLVKTGPPKGVTPSVGMTCSLQRLQVVNAASHPQILPGPDPIAEGSVASTSHRCMPLFFPGTDDEDEVSTPGATSTSMNIDEEDDNSPPLTNIAWRYRSPVPSAPSGPLPIMVSEVRPHLSIHQADPNSALFKLLGAPPVNKPKKCSHKKPKFDNLPPVPSDSATEGTVKAAQSSKKGAKGKETEDAPWGEAPPATIGIQIGGFGEEVPADYKAVQNGLKSIGVLVILRDFGKFIKVDKALWNKKIVPFVGEQYVKQCDQCYQKKTQCCKFLTNSVICVRCHYTKLPCLVNGTKALNPLQHYRPKSYESINAFESAMTTLNQHANALEDVVINFMAGVDALSHLQGVHAQIGQLRNSLGSDTWVEEVVEDEDKEGYNVDEVAEGEPGPSKKQKRSGK